MGTVQSYPAENLPVAELQNVDNSPLMSFLAPPIDFN